MKTNHSGDPHQRKSILQPLSPSGTKQHYIKFGEEATSQPDSVHTQPSGSWNIKRLTENQTVVQGTKQVRQAIGSIVNLVAAHRSNINRSIQVPVWAVALLVVVLVSVPVFVGVTQPDASESASEAQGVSSIAEEDLGEIQEEVQLSLFDLDLDSILEDPAVWQEPMPSGLSKRGEHLLSDGVNPARQEVRYAADEVERLQAELEAIQRNSALLRSLARQQSGDLSAAYSTLEATQEQKDGALEDLQARIDGLQGQIETVDELARELRNLLGLSETESGVGGPTGNAVTPDDENYDPWLALRADIVSIEQHATELVFDLDEINTEIQLRLAQVQQTGLPGGGSVEADLHFYDTMPVGMPVEGPITSRFGLRGNPFGAGSDMHTGIDIAAPMGTPVRATGGGTVRVAANQGGYGLLVIIDHGRGVSTWYGHNSRFLVSPGQQVNAGDAIAEVGSTGMSTGPHVHYEIRINNVAQDPISLMQLGR